MPEVDLLYSSGVSKINLFLKVTGKRPDNYHTLESLFLPLANPADDISIDLEALPGAITVGTSDIMLPGGTSNIAGKAAELWSRRACVMPQWDINIVKNIPVAAGMGGGSSDAATVLKLLNDHYQQPLSAGELAECALQLGADVPFFLEPRPAVMTGIGEIANALDFVMPELNILLLAPLFPVSAAEGYKLLDKNSVGSLNDQVRADIFAALRSGDLEKLAANIFNDLQDGVFNKYPLLPMQASAMERTGALKAVMSGSGPTLFAIYPDKASRAAAAAELAAAYPEFQVIEAEQL